MKKPHSTSLITIVITLLVMVFCGLITPTVTHAALDDELGGIGQPADGPTNETFKNLNPLIVGSADKPGADRTGLLVSLLGADYMSPTPAGIINRVLLFAFPIAGLILFLMILWGGFEILSGATTKKSMDQGKQRITAALIGFLLLFTSYWIVKVLETLFGVVIL